MVQPRFLDSVQVEKIREERGRPVWRLLHELRYDSQILSGRIVVPVGFVTDLASVPRVPIAWLFAGDTAHAPAVVHDYLYCIQWPTREIADNVFLEAMEVDGVSWFRRKVMYTMVRLFGQSAWDSEDHESVLSLRPS